MRLLKPEWVTNDDKPIFSVDIHPDGSRVATGGQGEDCGKVVIWNMGPIRDEKEEADLATPRILCQMDNHLGCVNCVRWSRNGKFLASGGDDKLVMIWQTSRGLGSGKSFGCSVTIVEQWRPVATLRGHSGDVLDLAWSPQDVWLASCSVDNSIVIWNALKFPGLHGIVADQVAILKGHSGLVKGVTWDPVGKYLASQSDDKSLKVWRTSDWKEESSITSCFEECGGTTHVLRLNWSPDGNHIVSAHAMNNRGPTAQIVERNGWGTSLDFVGHRKAITVVKFNPKILSKQIKRTSEKQQQYSCCAIGSKDRSLSIWLTALKRPLVVLHDLFEKSILDISWSSSGLELMCCSLDGTVAYLGFDQSEIGMPIFKDDQQALLERIYGKSVLASKATNASSHIIESAAVLNLQQEQQQQRERENSMSGSSVPPKALSAVVANGDQPFKPRDKQIETRTPDGKRRITPIFLAPQPDIGDAGIPAPFTNKSIAFNSSKETSKIITERQDRVTQPGLNVSSNSSQSHSLASPPHHPVNTIMHQPTAVSETKTGSTEPGATTPFIPLHTPIDVDKTPVRPVTSTPVARQEFQNDKERVKEKEKERDKDPDLDKTKDKDREKLKGNLSLKRRHGKVGRPRKSERETLMAAVVSHPLPVPAEPERTRPVATSQDLQLSVPTIQKSSVHLIEGQMGSDTCTTIEVENKLSVGTRQLHRVRCVGSGKVLWEQLLSSPVIAVAGSRQVTCVACEDKTLTVFGVGGRRLWPPLVLGSQVSVLKCTGCYIMAVTSQGYLYVWNSHSACGVIQGQTLSAIMTASERVLRAALTNEGVPLLTISSGRSFIFAPEIGSWMLVNDRDDYLHICSDHHRCTPSKGRASGPLASVQGGGSSNQQAGRIFQSDASMQQMSTVSHLENQLASSLALKSASEYCFWLETYIRYLAQEGLEGKLRAVCDDLLGPVYARTSGSNTWQPTVLGQNKREFLRQVLPVVGTNLRWQRLYTEYQEQLETLCSST